MSARAAEAPHGIEAAFAALGIAAVVGVGALVGVQGLQALLAVGVGAAALLILLKPLWGMMLMAATIPLESMFLVGDEVTATRMLGIAVAGAWIFQKLLRREPWGQLVTSPFLVTGGLFVAYALASLLWAVHPRLVASGVVQLTQLLLWAAIVVDLAASRRRSDLLAKALVFGALLTATLTIQQFYSGAYRRAGEDLAGGVNNTAVVLVTLLPLGFYLFRSRQSPFWRLAGLVYVGVAAAAVVVTFSRMNLLLLPPLLLVLLLEAIWSGGGRRWAVALGAALIAVGAYAIPWDRVVQRAETIGPYVESTLERGEPGRTAVSGRGYHMKVGLAIFRDHPVLGAGYLNYGQLFLDRYQFQVPGAPKLYSTPRSPHSSHIGILADLGIAGSLLWVLVLGTVLRACMRGWWAVRREGGSDRAIFMRAITYSVLLHIFAYALYYPNQRSKIFWTVLGIAVVARAVAEGRAYRSEERAPRPSPLAPVPARRLEPVLRQGPGAPSAAPFR